MKQIFELSEITYKYKQKIISYKDECLKKDTQLNGGLHLQKYSIFSLWYIHIKVAALHRVFHPFYVTSHIFAFEFKGSSSEDILGLVTIRPRINKLLKKKGGHIGLSIHPRYRSRGLGSILLSLSLDRCKVYNICPIIITCDKNNEASIRMIEKKHDKYIIQKMEDSNQIIFILNENK